MITCIVYVCPLGDLEADMLAFYRESRQRFGPNPAHRYMPHCSVTGFFQQDPRQLADLQMLMQQMLRRCPVRSLRVRERQDDPGFIHLPLQAPDLVAWSEGFAAAANAEPRPEAIRAKCHPHLSLAYDYADQQHAGLVALATELVDHGSACDWQLRLYERDPDWHWHCHASWPLPTSP